MYEITDWMRYEVNSKGNDATNSDDLRAGPLRFIRLKVHGHSQSTGYRKLLVIAKGRAMEVFGIFCKFLEIAGDSGKSQRGILRADRDGEPATAEDLAFLLGIPESNIQNALNILSDKRLGWITITTPPISPELPEIPLQYNSTQYNSTQSKDVDSVFDHWNSHKGKPWKSHKKLSPEITEAIKLRLKKYTVEELCKAIHNYASVLKGKDYTWSHAWTLREFLTRHRPDDRKELQLYRWLDNSFESSDHLTDSAKRSRGRLAVKKSEPEKQPEDGFDAEKHWKEMDFDKLVAHWKSGMFHKSIKAHRPDWEKIRDSAKG